MASTASVLPYSANRVAHLFLDVLRLCVQLHTVFFFASVKPTALPFIFEYIIQQGLTREASMSSSDREGQGFGLGVYGMMENRPIGDLSDHAACSIPKVQSRLPSCTLTQF